jgi:hypothetical protein
VIALPEDDEVDPAMEEMKDITFKFQENARYSVATFEEYHKEQITHKIIITSRPDKEIVKSIVFSFFLSV